MNDGKDDSVPDSQAAESSYVDLVSSIQRLSGVRKTHFPSYFPPMLASLAENAFSKSGWIYEPKMDGMRCIAFVDGDKVKLLSRRGKNITAQYPALAASLPALCKCKVVLDGEIIALNAEGKPSFQLLQQRMNLLNISDISRADARIPVHFFVFDLVYAAEYSLASTTLMNRKNVLQKCLTPSSNVLILRHFEENGKIAYDACIEHGFEGIVAKRRESPYETGRRSPYWVKVKGTKTSEFIVAGYSTGQGSRSNTFGSLVLGYYDNDDRLIYAGSVGSGFDERLLADMLRRMDPLKIDKCPILGIPSDKRDSTWVQPQLVAEIKFMDWTDDMHLRNPVFLHLRHDINPSDVRVIKPIDPSVLDSIDYSLKVAESSMQEPHNVQVQEAQVQGEFHASQESLRGEVTGATSNEEAASIESPSISIECSKDESSASLTKERTLEDIEREFPLWQSLAQSVIGQLSGKEKSYSLTVEQATISLTNLDKILFPASDDFPAVTKREYLRTIAFLSPYLLTHLYDRPLTMIRAPSGVRSRSFYQKHWNLDIPDYLENIRTEPDDPTRRDQLLCNSVAGLIFLAQNNILEYHVWLSRVPHLNRRGGDMTDLSLLEIPDFMAFDIDIHRDDEKESKQLDRELFNKARDAAFKLKETLDQLGLPSFLKTSGRNGLHVFIPIIRDLRFDEVRLLAEMIARHVETKYTQSISTSAVAAKRTSKVFLDYQANTRGKTITLPYSPRLTANATLSMPIKWSDLEKIYPGDFNQRTVWGLIEERGDIWREILRSPDDLAKRFHTKR